MKQGVLKTFFSCSVFCAWNFFFLIKIFEKSRKLDENFQLQNKFFSKLKHNFIRAVLSSQQPEEQIACFYVF